MPESDLSRNGEPDSLTADADRSADRPKRTFIVRGLSSRDEVLLRFYLSIARDQTDHVWKFSTELPADLLILGPDPETTQSRRAERDDAPVTIHVQREGAAQPGELTMPFKADELVRAVNVAGAAAHASTTSAMATAAVAAVLSRARTSAVSTGPAGTSRPGTMQIARSQRIALKRWPDAALLAASSWNMKLAAILTGRPISVPELVARSGAPEDVCAAFVHALLARQFASLVPATLSHAGEAMAFDAGREQDEARSPSPVAAPASQGLIARIRARLRL